MVNSTSAALLGPDLVNIIKKSFDDSLAPGEDPAPALDYGIPQLFEDNFNDASELAKVPLVSSLSNTDLRQSSSRLIRTRCYVYHSDSEIYGGAIRDSNRWHLTRYGLEAPDAPIRDNDVIFEERLSLLCHCIDEQDSTDDITASLSAMTFQERRSITLKLYNEKEEGLLHGCLDVLGILEPSGEEVVLHAVMTHQQRLASMIVDANPAEFNSEYRAETLQLLEESLLGDQLAAELLLLSLLSSVAVRTPVLIGPLVLNLKGISPETARKLISLLQKLTALMVPFDMSITNLNTAKLYASHDGEEFSPGLIQLPSDSSIVLNECALAEGKLDNTGVKNLQTLNDIITNQETVFHFPFSSFKIPTDVSVIILSHGKSLLPNTLALPLKKGSTWTLATGHTVSQLRAYICKSKILETEIEEDLSLQIQDDFVKSRKAGSDIDQDGLSMTLALAKGVAKSFLHRKVSWDDYKHAKALYARIKQRQQDHITVPAP